MPRNLFRSYKIEDYQKIHDLFVNDETFEIFFEERLEYVTNKLENELLSYSVSDVSMINDVEKHTWYKDRCAKAINFSCFVSLKYASEGQK